MKSFHFLVGIIVTIATSVSLLAQSPVLSSVAAPYPNLPSQVTFAGQTWAPGTVAYGPANTPLILSGWNFGSSGTVIFTAYKNGAVDPNVPPVNATVTQWTAGKLTLTVPANAYTGTIKVTSGGMTSNALPFMVTRNSYSSSCPQLPPAQETTPAVASLTPPSGSAGLAVNISGSAFGAVQGQGYVTFNGAVATVLRWSDSSITAIVPGNPATGPVVVTLEGGQTSNNNVIFTVNAALCTPL